MKNKRAIIIGASAGLGRSLSIELAKYGVNQITICSSDIRDLLLLKKHIETVYKVNVHCLELKFDSNYSTADEVIMLIKKQKINLIYFPIGFSCNDALLNKNFDLLKYILDVNFVNITYICSSLFRSEIKIRNILFVGFGSIASARGRSTNVFYSASKRALRSFFESLNHALGDSKSNVQYYELGYLDTSLAVGNTKFFKPANVDQIAKKIISNVNKGSIFAYLPSYWFLIVVIIKLIPNYFFKKLKF